MTLTLFPQHQSEPRRAGPDGHGAISIPAATTAGRRHRNRAAPARRRLHPGSSHQTTELESGGLDAGERGADEAVGGQVGGGEAGPGGGGEKCGGQGQAGGGEAWPGGGGEKCCGQGEEEGSKMGGSRPEEEFRRWSYRERSSGERCLRSTGFIGQAFLFSYFSCLWFWEARSEKWDFFPRTSTSLSRPSMRGCDNENENCP